MRYIIGHNSRKPGPLYDARDCGYATPCWVWLRACDSHGYGSLWDKGRCLKAHRALYERHVGPVPDGLDLDHLCRNPPCVNPDHLEVVTRAENTRRGQAARLTAEDVRAIRASIETQVVLAAHYGVAQPTISKILRGETWIDV
jgi:hypothetical protein